MEALSPLDTNTHIRKDHIMKQGMKQNVRQLSAPVKQNSKEKENPPKPPSEVFEPANTDQKDGFTYKTGRMLGRGGFAVCYEGQNTTTKRIFALKMVQSLMPQKKMEQKFQTELQIHSKMRHANIVEFHRAFSYQKYTYIVLELCPNGSLMDIIKKRTYVTEPEVRYWIVQMSGAIKYMHNKGVIHRDLKMGNIFLDKNMNVKIGDFGLAALLMSGKDLQACRRTTLCGTPNYIAPEILSKDKSGHDHAVDIWSLGIIIFALLTGKPPFQSATATEIYRRARDRDYDWPAPGKSKNHISFETKNLVAELLQAPNQRPEPDQIVQHPFFKCGWTPRAEDMTVCLKEKHPDSAHFFSGNDPERSIDGIKNLQRLCIYCEVGPWTPPRKYKSTYREVAEEEKFGLTPSVPLSGNVIYRPFHIWLQEKVNALKENEEKSENALQSMKEAAPPVPKKLPKYGSSLRPSVQSFAAQQRAKYQVLNNEAQTGSRRESQVSLAISSTGSVNSLARSEIKSRDPAPNVEDRLPNDMLNNLKIRDDLKISQKPFISETSLGDKISIFDKTENIQLVPNTTPESILKRLHLLQAELERALKSRSMAIDRRAPKRSPVIVVKWVDYTNKFGLGYILSNGSVGTLFRSISAFHNDKSKSLNPPTCVLVRNSEKHLINQNNLDWPDYGQLVPMSGHNIEFFENRGSKGLFSTEIAPEKFRCVPGPNGELFKLSAGQNEFDNRKRERVALWRKFGNYMTQYGRDADYPHDEFLKLRNDTETSDRRFVTFYQRWGDVGCWSFDDGHLQFNFPDHTKIILSADGTWCDFYHLSVSAAHELSDKGILSARALDERQHLSYPLQTMLNFISKTPRSKSQRQPEIDPNIQNIPQANDLRRKIKFILSCVKEWTKNGGIGISDLSVKGRLRWSGARQTVGTKIPYKQVWVSVGGQAIDERKVMWFDPRVPDFILPDVDT